jgi:hypothetical protein
VINISKENEKYKNIVRGSLTELLSELELVISMIYIQGIFKEGYSVDVISETIDLCNKRGMEKVIEAMKDFE